MKNVFQGFKEFISRGNAIDLAVGVVIGAAFATVVTAIQEHLIDPIISTIFGSSSMRDLWVITLSKEHKTKINVGELLDAGLQFILVAAAVYFVIVVPMNKLRSLRKTEEVVEEAAVPAQDIVLLQEIRDLLAKK